MKNVKEFSHDLKSFNGFLKFFLKIHRVSKDYKYFQGEEEGWEGRRSEGRRMVRKGGIEKWGSSREERMSSGWKSRERRRKNGKARGSRKSEGWDSKDR